MRVLLFFAVFLCTQQIAFSQYTREAIQSNSVLGDKRKSFDTYLRESTIAKAFSMPLDSNSEYQYESACWAISQFLIQSPVVKSGFDSLYIHYTQLQYSTKRAFIEAAYATYPRAFARRFDTLLQQETNPKLFAMQAVYLARVDSSMERTMKTLTLLQQRFPGADTLPLLQEFKKYIVFNNTHALQLPPSFNDLFANQKLIGQKIVYSFQRWDRNYPGLAIIQNADGSFVKDTAGKVLVFQQLARAGSNLPYFLTNGNTPQGIFSIQGTAISHNNFIGPTPNIQLVMPGEGTDSAYWHMNTGLAHTVFDSTKDALGNYTNLLPASWQSYEPLKEAFYAGKIGRSEIIAHGTTINPEYFKGMPFYPLTPTLGCLCAKELWNEADGKLSNSEQFSLVSAFLSTPGDKGYLFVIDLNNKKQPVTKAEIQKLVDAFEKH
ncbi:MAG: hypothetical protein J0I41_12815 [Filimonas sp.]|nr:hypothetical protein [Filimonas sp.]